jgi:hypothetical protein
VSVAWDIETRLVSAPGLPVPGADLARACAHDLLTARDANGHVTRHLETAQAAASPSFDLKHAHSHVDEMTGHLDSLIVNLKRLVPAISDEIGLLSQAMRAADVADAPADALPRTCAHVLMTARVAAGHVRRHLDAAIGAGTPVSAKFNISHALGHAGEVREHLAKLTDGLERYVPPVGKEINLLEQAIWGEPGQPAPPGSRSAGADYEVAGGGGPEPA